MGTRLGELIQAHIDSQEYPPSARAIARRVGVSPTRIGTWRTGPLKDLPEVGNLEALARVLGVPYRVVLQAALVDAGYVDDLAGAGDGAPMKRAGGRPATDEERAVFNVERESLRAELLGEKETGEDDGDGESTLNASRVS